MEKILKACKYQEKSTGNKRVGEKSRNEKLKKLHD